MFRAYEYYNPTNRTVSGSIFNHTTTTDITYDSASNRTSWDDGTAVNYTIPAGSNKTSAVGGDSYTYDDAGNITDDGTNSYTWNAAGDLSSVDYSSATVGAYSYDWMHRRVKKVAASTTTYYVYGPGGLLFGEYDSNGDMIREYIYLNPSPEALAQGGGEPLAQIDAGSPEVLTYLHTDHLGAPRYGTNTGGTQVWSWNYDAFGDGSTSGSVTVNLRLPGQYYDAESGLYYNWNRYYNPVIGRYISSDPIGLAGGMNTYNYANVSPLMYIDPWGLTAQCPPTLSDIERKMCYENGAAEGFVPYPGKEEVYHCGGCTYLEYREDPSSAVNDPVGECTYDAIGNLIDDGHPYSGCKGTADQYPVYNKLNIFQIKRHLGPDDMGGPKFQLSPDQTLGQKAKEESERYKKNYEKDPNAVIRELLKYKYGPLYSGYE